MAGMEAACDRGGVEAGRAGGKAACETMEGMEADRPGAEGAEEESVGGQMESGDDECGRQGGCG